MLIIRRKPMGYRRDQEGQFVLGSSVAIGLANVTVMGIDTFGHVVLGIDAPPEVEVLRDDAKVKERKERPARPRTHPDPQPEKPHRD